MSHERIPWRCFVYFWLVKLSEWHFYPCQLMSSKLCVLTLFLLATYLLVTMFSFLLVFFDSIAWLFTLIDISVADEGRKVGIVYIWVKEASLGKVMVCVDSVLMITNFSICKRKQIIHWSNPEPSLNTIIVISAMWDKIVENKCNIQCYIRDIMTNTTH